MAAPSEIAENPGSPPETAAETLHRLYTEIARRDAYIHELHVARLADRRQYDRAVTDAVRLIGKLEVAEDECERLRRKVAALAAPPARRWEAAWRALQGRPNQAEAAAPAPAGRVCPPAAFTFDVVPTPFRIYREPAFTLKGWAFPNDGQPVTALRARVDETEFAGTYGLEEPEIVKRFGQQAENPHPGFRIPIQTPPGRHRLFLEARLGAGDWVCFFSAPIWVETE